MKRQLCQEDDLVARILVATDQLQHKYGVYGAKGDWDIQISDLVKNPDGTDI